MPIFIVTSLGAKGATPFDSWCAIGAQPALDPSRIVPDLAGQMEAAYDAISSSWWELARSLNAEPSAALAHAPACAANVSDFGLMLAWDHLVRQWRGAPSRILVVCDDPWLFRHLAPMAAVAGRPPPLVRRSLVLWGRGGLARLLVAVRMAWSTLRLARDRRAYRPRSPALLVYGHPVSRPDGTDGYFGRLMADAPALRRVLHVDCDAARARALKGGAGQTVSLHAWGSLGQALGLPFARWRPRPDHLHGNFGWLVRRAAALEGSTGQPAMVRWQQICQRAWLSQALPSHVAWPWENHAWERDLVAQARQHGIRTIGYQHATVGTREWNHSPRSSPVGEESLPDLILVSGSQWQKQLLAFGCPSARVQLAGAWRAPALDPLPHDPKGPVFVALPADSAIAEEMVDAVRPLAEKGHRFEIKEHPMSPFPFAEGKGLSRASEPLARHSGVSAVLYAATTVGLEALIGGLPTLRFQPRSRVPNDIAAGFAVPVCNAETLDAALKTLRPSARVDAESVFAVPRLDIWRAAFDQYATQGV